jgi:nucleoside-diphosphate-sugar epimerase
LRLFAFGYGYAARALARRLASRGWRVAASARGPQDVSRLEAEGVEAVLLTDTRRLADAIAAAQALLISAPPTPEGCPALAALSPILRGRGAPPAWTGYLSTTGVYGDRGGGWVFETSALAARSAEAIRRVAAERAWTELARAAGLSLAIFRLPGIYGPGRSAFDRLREARARRIASPGQVFSRIHVDDLAAGLEASIDRPRAGGTYNLCDDEPCANGEVIAFAARLLGLPVPPEVALADARLPGAAARFYAESKRVSNARAKAELGWRPAYPTYREGLAAVLEAERSPAVPS